MAPTRPLVVISQPIPPSALERLETFADVEMGEDSSRIMARADLLERVRRADGALPPDARPGGRRDDRGGQEPSRHRQHGDHPGHGGRGRGDGAEDPGDDDPAHRHRGDGRFELGPAHGRGPARGGGGRGAAAGDLSGLAIQPLQRGGGARRRRWGSSAWAGSAAPWRGGRAASTCASCIPSDPACPRRTSESSAQPTSRWRICSGRPTSCPSTPRSRRRRGISSARASWPS